MCILVLNINLSTVKTALHEDETRNSRRQPTVCPRTRSSLLAHPRLILKTEDQQKDIE